MGWNLCEFQGSLLVLLAATATLGYMVGRWRRSGELCPRCKEELMQSVLSKSNPKAECRHEF
jgi:hypothetical protein